MEGTICIERKRSGDKLKRHVMFAEAVEQNRNNMLDRRRRFWYHGQCVAKREYR